MKYSDIVDIKTLKAYCRRQYGTTITYPSSHSPFHSSPEGNFLGELYASPTKALGYRLFNESINWCMVNLIYGIIYSYDTPIGLMLNNSIVFVTSKQLPFKSATTKKLVTILNRNFMTIEYKQFRLIIEMLGINLGWLE